MAGRGIPGSEGGGTEPVPVRRAGERPVRATVVGRGFRLPLPGARRDRPGLQRRGGGEAPPLGGVSPRDGGGDGGGGDSDAEVPRRDGSPRDLRQVRRLPLLE